MNKSPKNIHDLALAIKNCSEEYRKSEKNEIVMWRSIDEFLEDMCTRFPYHDSLNQVLIKITAIDRLYIAGLNRKKVNYKKFASQLVDSDLDNQLENVGRSLNSKNIKKVATAVATVAGLGNPENPRYWVFASKYLHFHDRNIFPILDRFAEDELKNIFVRLKLEYDNNSNENRYEKFCRKLITLQSFLSRQDYTPPTLSDFDKYLYGKRYLKCK